LDEGGIDWPAVPYEAEEASRVEDSGVLVDLRFGHEGHEGGPIDGEPPRERRREAEGDDGEDCAREKDRRGAWIR